MFRFGWGIGSTLPECARSVLKNIIVRADLIGYILNKCIGDLVNGVGRHLRGLNRGKKIVAVKMAQNNIPREGTCVLEKVRCV